jgi:hypothetical protein
MKRPWRWWEVALMLQEWRHWYSRKETNTLILTERTCFQPEQSPLDMPLFSRKKEPD